MKFIAIRPNRLQRSGLPTPLPFAAGFFLSCVTRGLFRLLHGAEFAAFFGGPAGLVDLAAAGDPEAVRRDIFRDGRAGGDVRVIADAQRRDEDRIASDKYFVADGGRKFFEAVVVASDGAGADVGFGSNLGIAR